MTVQIRDMSHYDTDESLAGFVGATHKVTEGTSYVDPAAKRRLNAWRARGLPVIGSYHVLHTGNLQAQLTHWVSTLDSIAAWWRTFPCWVMQIDGERWATDNVQPATVVQFARILVGSGLPGWKVTYASRGQYGDSLAGIVTPLWNAAYHSSAYPGDGAADWRPYAGKAPALWQYTSTPFDKSAFRGTLQQLQALIRGNNDTGGDALMALDDAAAHDLVWTVYNILHGDDPSGRGDKAPNVLHQRLAALKDQVGALSTTSATQEQVDAAVLRALQDATVQGAIAGKVADALRADLVALLGGAQHALGQ